MTLSFKRYALLLGVIVIAIYVVLGILGYRQYQTAKLGIERLDQLSAEAEFQRAFTKVLADLDQGRCANAERDSHPRLRGWRGVAQARWIEPKDASQLKGFEEDSWDIIW